jgi:hypothetical protein
MKLAGIPRWIAVVVALTGCAPDRAVGDTGQTPVPDAGQPQDDAQAPPVDAGQDPGDTGPADAGQPVDSGQAADTGPADAGLPPPPCGGLDEPCCGGALCNAGGFCAADRCQPCGWDGQPCCPGALATSCGTGTFCVDARCAPCGGHGQPCCDEVTSISDAGVYSFSGTCTSGSACGAGGFCS